MSPSLNPSPEKRRVLLLLTENAPARPLWRAAVDLLAAGDAELIAVYVADERWVHAARLPFVREISSVTGSTSEFTHERASRLIEAAAARARRKVERLAARKKKRISFEIMTGLDLTLIERLMAGAPLTMVAPQELSGTPLHLTLVSQHCEVVLVGPKRAGG